MVWAIAAHFLLKFSDFIFSFIVDYRYNIVYTNAIVVFFDVLDVRLADYLISETLKTTFLLTSILFYDIILLTSIMV